MLSKNQLRNISKLSTKKNRQESGLFLAEGEKLVYELLDSGWKANNIFTTVPIQKINHIRIDSDQMKKISHLASASKILGVFHLPKYDSNHLDRQGFSLVLDNAIRTAHVHSTTPLKYGVLKLEDFTKIVKDNPGIGGNVYFEVAKAAVNNLATVSGDVSNLTQAFFYALSR